MTQQTTVNPPSEAQTPNETDKDQAQPNMPFAEFIILMALLMSLPALSTDAILPSLDQVGRELGHTVPQDLQKVITTLFAGLAIGQLFYGPLSDQLGRKKTIFIGMAIFIAGNILAMVSTSFETLMLGRFLQGIGVAGPRIVLIALVRDLFVGRAMARVMSFVMGVFIFVPVIAPILGQVVAQIAGWRSLFLFFMLLSTIGGVWLLVRQKETLPPSRRIKISPASLWNGTRTVFTTVSCLGYMIGAGIVMGPFVLYISIAQHLFQSTYGLGENFPYFFAGLALSIGVASFANSRLAVHFGMRRVAKTAVTALIILAAISLAVSYPYGFVPPLWLFVAMFCPMFFCIGLMFGNMNSLAMEEVGHVAGMASAWVGAISTFIAMGIATGLGLIYDGSILALAGAFVFCGLASVTVITVTEKLRPKTEAANRS
ncbi:MFS transporter, DHA1 family, bicyclomycin/chloramphenicol resistance protein [Cohaesibacter sp. ES.047]|uniref:multidrug effflux MFS transporter n=1 Tax=Cohaesibacter sp. ES.047 TaxID=1798205 RepID=UPI000BB68168|nr:multidrug effflux MFS transporter [Cohaesibacter sp. ES.047]SNY92007.1 MFS transporter, DHA1 family, bicyclomycin/chloramphenicol resistance protein [Cohaesibacter sp. ES.047]